MQSKSKTLDKNKVETNQFNVSHTAACPEPWWNTMGSMGYSSISPAMMRGSASDSSSLEQSMDGHSQSDSRMNDDDDDAAAGRHSQSAVNQQSGIFGRFFFFFFFFSLPSLTINRKTNDFVLSYSVRTYLKFIGYKFVN